MSLWRSACNFSTIYIFMKGCIHMKSNKHNRTRLLYVTCLLLIGLNIIFIGLYFNSIKIINKDKVEINYISEQLQELNESIKVFQDDIEKLKLENASIKEENKNLKAEIDRVKLSKGLVGNDSSKKIIYLTFDDGPSIYTNDILNILAEKGVKATFFVANRDYNDGYINILKSGNKLGLHTNTHDYNRIYKSNRAFINDVESIRKKVFDVTGENINIYRFPGGSSNSFVKKDDLRLNIDYLHSENLEYFDWNCDSTDSTGANVSVSTIVLSSQQCSNKNIINLLMHDNNGHINTVKALPEVIDYYISKGYEFRTLDSSSYLIQHRK